MTSRYAALSREELAVLLPELLLIGQLIDRSGMAWCISAFGRDEMAQVAIDEWAASSPVYTRRMQKALRYEGDDIITIFKGLQLDIGAPPQFMDFRYTVHDRWNGEFHLDHCGALMDVEPMGDDYVKAMCHDIEDPTFDATAVATNPKAQVRPIHRPPRVPADRDPHCAWTVIIDESYPDAPIHPELATVAATRAATHVLDEIVPGGGGMDAYDGPLLSDLDFADFSRAALVRMADEVCLQMHLLVLSFRIAVDKRATDVESATKIATKQLIGISGIAAERIRAALGIDPTVEGALRVAALHPLLNPYGYVPTTFDDQAGTITVTAGDSYADGGWISLLGPGRERPLEALLRGVHPQFGVEVTGDDSAWTARVVVEDLPGKPIDEVEVTRFSTGAGFAFEPRRSLPLYVV
ncbi:MAG: hypothetical protein ACI379_09040 [Nocardioides sp.]|uniref:hypothetical protein n=1 Tax=Nocardioides sp. TaxID=35761 RepID=UPI003F00653F